MNLSSRVNKSISLTISLFKMEIDRLHLDLENMADEELKRNFPVLLADYKNPDGTPHNIFVLNMAALKELIGLLKTQT